MKTRTEKTEIQFAAEALVSRVEAFAAGRAPARERTMKQSLPVKAMGARESRVIGSRISAC